MVLIYENMTKCLQKYGKNHRNRNIYLQKYKKCYAISKVDMNSNELIYH